MEIPQSYLSDDFESSVDDNVINRHEREMGKLVHQLLPHSVAEDIVPEVIGFNDFNGDFAEYLVSVEVHAPRDAKVTNSVTHAHDGYLIEFHSSKPFIKSDGEGPMTLYELRVVDTGMDSDPIDALVDPETVANPVVNPTTFLVEIHYHHTS